MQCALTGIAGCELTNAEGSQQSRKKVSLTPLALLFLDLTNVRHDSTVFIMTLLRECLINVVLEKKKTDGYKLYY